MLVAGWVLVAVLVLIGVGFLAWGVRERRWYAGFARRAVAVRGEVTGGSAHRGVGTGMHGQPTGTMWYRAHVRFPGPGGAPVQARMRYPVAARPRVGDLLDVAYDPERPRRVVLAGTRPPGAVGTTVLGGSVLAAAYVVQVLVRTLL